MTDGQAELPGRTGAAADVGRSGASATSANTLLGQLLVGSGMITPEELQQALIHQEATGQRLGDVLQDMGAVDPTSLERALRAQARLRGRTDSTRPFILVVDDDPEIGALLADILQGAGYRVGIAQDGSEALAALLSTDLPGVAAIVLDLGLPNTGGIELLAVLRKTESTHKLPVVVLTGRPDLESTLRERGLTFSAFLAKPISARKLLEIIETAVTGTSRDRVLNATS